MILSAKVIKNPRKERRCEGCERLIQGRQLKLYGMAHIEDKPYNLFFHLKCEGTVNMAEDPKVQKALRGADGCQQKIVERLRFARELSGLSQGQVAKILSLKRPAISEIEAGRRKISAEELATLSEIYGVSIAWLAGVDEDLPQLATKEITKLRPEDRGRLLKLLKMVGKGTIDEKYVRGKSPLEGR